MTKCKFHIWFLAVAIFGFQLTAMCQNDTLRNPTFDTTKPVIPVDSLSKIDSPYIANIIKVDSMMFHHSPKKAAIRSAIIPGWGQIYNKRIWKVPIIWGALGVSAGIFIFNLNNYRDLRFAYKAKYEASMGDSTNLPFINPELEPLDLNALRTYRDEFRQNIDYSALFFILLWGLNVVDATVDAHLRSFDVSKDLGFQFRLGNSKMAGTTGVSLVLAFK